MHLFLPPVEQAKMRRHDKNFAWAYSEYGMIAYKSVHQILVASS